MGFNRASLGFNKKEKTKPKVLLNIGATFDIPTGTVVTGPKGESIINGGLGFVTGIAGPGNNYKSTMLHYMMLSAANRIRMTHDTALNTYDTEVNISLDRLEHMGSWFSYLPEMLITGPDAIWDITDKSLQPANEWATEFNEYVKTKEKDKSLIVPYNCFKDPYTKEELKLHIPTIAQTDSISEFEAESTSLMLEKDLDSSDTNTYAMKQALFKTKFLSQLPRQTTRSNTYFLMTAHIGKKIDMATGPAKYQQPSKELQYLKAGDTIKGISPKSYYLLNNFWFAHTATLLKNPTTKLPEYPLNSDDVMETDLNVVKVTLMRGKHGPSGYTLEIVVSQIDGVLPTLTEFHHIKTNNKYGIGGNDRSYYIELCPDVNLSRTTVRRKTEEDEKLQRAINITSELLQLDKFHPWVRRQGLSCTPKELYDDLKAMGYDWDVLLDTRGYWLIDNYSKECKPFLSSVDLLRMRKGLYKPYWYKGEIKDVGSNEK